MATYLLTWNPTRYGHDWQSIEDCIQEIEKHGYYKDDWSCGVTKRIVPGDRVFLLKQGAEPRGIIASGWATSKVRQKPHWDLRARAEGRKALYVDVEFDVILNPAKRIFPRSRLDHGIYARMHWDVQASGRMIPDEIAEQLERDWAEFVGRPIYTPTPSPEEVTETYYEGARKRVTVNAYERNPRARQACIQHYGLSCAVCGFNFEEVYGSIGEGYIHVHHIVPLSEIDEAYEIDPIADLRPVCPNCHAMLHRRSPAYAIEELRAILNNRKGNHRLR
ncbi:MAG: HNH endonuclease [Anaerolineae bacterium]|nr:HNH endonuclease [Anaerolineae bacterium]